MRQTVCAKCGQDIEGTYREGFRDRGNNRECVPTGKVDRDGISAQTPRGNHRPNDYRGCLIERDPVTGYWKTFSSETGSLMADTLSGLKWLIRERIGQ